MMDVEQVTVRKMVEIATTKYLKTMLPGPD